MADADDDILTRCIVADWTRTCWSSRFSGSPCGKPARWRGPDLGPFNRAWRACDQHHEEGDVPMEGDADG